MTDSEILTPQMKEIMDRRVKNEVAKQMEEFKKMYKKQMQATIQKLVTEQLEAKYQEEKAASPATPQSKGLSSTQRGAFNKKLSTIPKVTMELTSPGSGTRTRSARNGSSLKSKSFNSTMNGAATERNGSK